MSSGDAKFDAFSITDEEIEEIKKNLTTTTKTDTLTRALDKIFQNADVRNDEYVHYKTSDYIYVDWFVMPSNMASMSI